METTIAEDILNSTCPDNPDHTQISTSSYHYGTFEFYCHDCIEEHNATHATPIRPATTYILNVNTDLSDDQIDQLNRTNPAAWQYFVDKNGRLHSQKPAAPVWLLTINGTAYGPPLDICADCLGEEVHDGEAIPGCAYTIVLDAVCQSMRHPDPDTGMLYSG